MCVFFFKQKTAYERRISDWSSDVCSSDLENWPEKPSARNTMFATCPDRPGISRLAPSTISHRSTSAAEMRVNWVTILSALVDGRAPLNSTLPAAWPSPPTASFPRTETPGPSSHGLATRRENGGQDAR